MTTTKSSIPITALTALSALRSAAGATSWIAPGLVWRATGLGPMPADPRNGLISRLFGVRDLALGLAVRHPDPQVRRTALRVGIAIDTADTAASLIAVAKGAPKVSLLGVAAGATFFVGLALKALSDET